MTSLKHLVSLTLVVGSMALAGCDGSSSTNPVMDTPDPEPPTSAEPVQDKLGAGFSAAFNAEANGEPVRPADGDIIALDKTAEPFDVPNPE